MIKTSEGWCIKVHKHNAQSTKEKLMKHKIIDHQRRPAKSGEHVIFPIIDEAPDRVEDIIRIEYYLIKDACPRNERIKGDLPSQLKGILPATLLKLVPKSFNIVGDIAIIELDEDLLEYKEEIAKRIKRLHPHLKSIYQRGSKRTGEYRTRDLQIIWGEDNSITIHKENGCKFRIDVKDLFFDPRLSEEHSRIVDEIKNNWAGNKNKPYFILDLFCGAGPFVVPLAKLKNVQIHCLDLNPVAIQLLRENLDLNNIDRKKVTCVVEDARKYLTSHSSNDSIKIHFSEIILNLPSKAHMFLDKLKPLMNITTTTRIFWYTIAPEFTEKKHAEQISIENALELIESAIKPEPEETISKISIEGLKKVKNLGWIIEKITRVKPYAPYKYIYCFTLVHYPQNKG